MTKTCPPVFSKALSAAASFVHNRSGAVTSSFLVLSSAAVTVTTATVLTVSTGAESKGVEITEKLVQIAPNEVLDLSQPPYSLPADDTGEEAAVAGEPSIIETEAFAPQRSQAGSYNPAALIEGSEFTAGGGSGGSGSSGGGGGLSGGMLMGSGGSTDVSSEESEVTVGSRS